MSSLPHKTPKASEERALDTNGYIYYGITIKKTGMDNFTEPDEIVKCLRSIIQKSARYKLNVHKYSLELDSKFRLHLHALIDGKPRAWIKPMPGWHIHLCPIASQEDKIAWESYITKCYRNGTTMEHIIQENYYRNCYMFPESNISPKGRAERPPAL